MGQTLTHGIYLPDEGERNCYSGLAGNWTILDNSVGTIAEHTTQIAGKASAVHTHTKSDITDFPAYGNTAGTICEGNDSRLSDARTPVAHTHTKSDVTDLLNSNFIPSANNSYDLGNSTYKWKTLNGINPGALSLPDYDNADPINFSQWDVTGAVGSNYYTPTVNGWLNISIWDRATNSIFVYRSGRERVGVFGNGSMASDGRIALLMPVQANATYIIIIKANANSDIYSANFFPCLGNV